MKIIDRKALVAALIMACGNGVCGMDALPGDNGAGDNGRGGKRARLTEKDSPAGAGSSASGAVSIAAATAEQTALEGMLKRIPALKPLHDKLNKLTLSQLNSFNLLLKDMYGYDEKDIIRALGRLNEDQIQEVATHAQTLFADVKVVGNRTSIMNALALLNVEQIQEVVTHARTLFSGTGAGDLRAGIIRALAPF